MAELSVLYASALFNLAVESGAVDEIYEQAVMVREALADADTRRVLMHPHITNAEKRDFFGGAFKGSLHDDLYSLLLLVIDKNRESFFPPAIKTLISLIDQHRRKTSAHVLSAAGLEAGQVAVLKDILSKKLEKQVEVFVKIDPSLIGGPYINVDGYFIDRTIKRKLQDLAADMKVGYGA